MPSAVWTGTLSFGLVTVPVRLVNATEPKDVRFHLYDRAGRRVRYERVVEAPPEPSEADAESSEVDVEPSETDVEPSEAAAEPAPPGDARDATADDRPGEAVAPTPRPVAWDELLRGRETDSGDVVLLSREELDRVRPQRSRSIEIEDFVELGDIDPVYFEKTYYAVPRSPEAATPYVLLHRAMREAGRIGIGRFVLRTKPHLVAVRPMRDVLAVETMFFGDEVRDPAELIPGLGGAEFEQRELDLAVRLIEMLKTEWNPEAYADTYREELLRLLAEKAPTTPPLEEIEEAATGTSAVEQLMAALRQSVEAAEAKRRPRSERAG